MNGFNLLLALLFTSSLLSQSYIANIEDYTKVKTTEYGTFEESASNYKTYKNGISGTLFLLEKDSVNVTIKTDGMSAEAIADAMSLKTLNFLNVDAKYRCSNPLTYKPTDIIVVTNKDNGSPMARISATCQNGFGVAKQVFPIIYWDEIMRPKQ